MVCGAALIDGKDGIRDRSMKPSLSKIWKRFGWLLMALPMVVGQAGAQEPSPTVLRVGTTNAPPFAWKADDGQWFGIGIELWRELAAELGWQFQLHERKFTDLLKDVEDGSLDAGVAAITITADREVPMDFTHRSHYRNSESPFRGGARPKGGQGRGALPYSPFSLPAGGSDIGPVHCRICRLALRTAQSRDVRRRAGKGRRQRHLVVRGHDDDGWLWRHDAENAWRQDRRHHLDVHVDHHPFELYGRDHVLAYGQWLGGPVNGLADLKSVRVGTVDGTASAAFLADQGIVAAGFSATSTGLRALADGEIDAFVEDAPILQYLVNKNFRGRLQVLPQRFDRQYYGIALPTGSNLREPLNRALLRFIHTEDWQSLVERDLGGSGDTMRD